MTQTEFELAKDTFFRCGVPVEAPEARSGRLFVKRQVTGEYQQTFACIGISFDVASRQYTVRARDHRRDNLIGKAKGPNLEHAIEEVCPALLSYLDKTHPYVQGKA